ncbi:molybdate ABC transporter substrate-binding protein [Azospirillum halopraeferens]|uniref:molybdate ABC transporter substrate-binding protein n=1 Tax=Azospirillum halopraeferens TaxID=34010 RepID=UPI00048A9DE8|nr:molybdate ABC transporter substrate-binding protein [Azospirillum halopraeferens]
MTTVRLGIVKTLAAVLVGAAMVVAAPAAMAQDVLVMAAASMKNAIEKAAAEFTAGTGIRVIGSFAASSALAKQIENGARADIVVSADLDWMDYLETRNLIKPESRVNLFGNDLVLIAPAGSTVAVDLKPGVDLAGLLGTGRLAVGDPTNVPVGRYAQAALTGFGIWESVGPKLARTDNVRAALALVSRGETPLGIVYRTDAQIDRGVTIAATFPADSHPPIVYPFALTATTTNPNADLFFSHLKSDGTAAVFRSFGFTPLPRPQG